MTTEEDWTGDSGAAGSQEETERTPVPEPLIPGYSTFDEYLQEAYDAMRAGIKAANNLPQGENYNYYSCFPSFNGAKGKDMRRLLNIVQNVLGSAGVAGKIAHREVEEKFDLILEANDVLLDRANALMDEESGVVKNSKVELVISEASQKVNGSWNAVSEKQSEVVDQTQSVRLLAAKNIHRPQLSFKDKIDNTAKPWCPRIKDKPNSLKPLALYLEETEEGEVYNHPYEVELDKFTPPDCQLTRREPVKYKPLDNTPLVMVEKPSDIKSLLEDLKDCKEIAIDLEHHSYRTFQGITCLMQISTVDKDYLVDTLSLRSELHELNEIFTKPTILKVFHGADQDVQWLQRDLSLYVVNMFDTHQAAKQLNLPYLSLAYLLKTYCNIDPNKHFRLADWRIRPLPEELIRYAREDTHYLLHIKDVLRNALIDSANGQSNILKAVYDRSTEICRKVYVKPVWTENSYMNMYRKSHKVFNNKQMYALRELHKWRDVTARLEDDSTSYVLPNHMLLNIAETLPREMQGVLACCNPIPPLVRQNLLKLHKVILKAREQPLIKPVIEEDLRQRLVQRTQVSNSEAWIYSPHDIPSGAEARADLPCLLDNVPTIQQRLPSDNLVDHTVTVFDTSEEEDETSKEDRSTEGKKFVFISPFERYKRVIPMIAQQEAQEREQQKLEEEERLRKVKDEEEQTNQSKSRVFEHFKNVAETSTGRTERKSKAPLSEMHGRKRKRNSGISRDEDEPATKASNNLSTPVPTINRKIVQGGKPETGRAEELKQEKEILKDLATMQDKAQGNDAVKPMRQRVKGDKKKMEKQLQKSGKLPSQRFDYRSVDFGSFQGGSKDAPNRTNFDDTQKRKQKGRKRKKQKINI